MRVKSIQFDPDLTHQFIRGQDFNVVLHLPVTVQEGEFENWVPTSQVRRLDNAGPGGLIADLSVTWVDPIKAISLHFQFPDTSDWPLGPAELDLVLTSPEGFTKRSLPIRFNITYGVTK